MAPRLLPRSAASPAADAAPRVFRLPTSALIDLAETVEFPTVTVCQIWEVVSPSLPPDRRDCTKSRQIVQASRVVPDKHHCVFPANDSACFFVFFSFPGATSTTWSGRSRAGKTAIGNPTAAKSRLVDAPDNRTFVVRCGSAACPVAQVLCEIDLYGGRMCVV